MHLAWQNGSALSWTPTEGGQGLSTKVNTVHTIEELRDQVTNWREEGYLIALVPTMGALHDGHISLVQTALQKANRVVVSIFVNPAQFAPHEDFEAYPRETARDREQIARAGGHLVYAPSAEEMYPPGFSTRIFVGGVSEGLCGAARPHFFSGVATVVAKLFLQAMPDMAVFGEKDYQQLLVVRHLVQDLNLPIEILSAPVVREDDGLALSSRNAYLNVQERAIAPLMYRTISDIAQDIAQGRAIDESVEAGRVRLESAGFLVDYLEVRDSKDLALLSEIGETSARVLVAAHLGRTRLIDNFAVPNHKYGAP